MSINSMRRKFGHQMRIALYFIAAIFVLGIVALGVGSRRFYGPEPSANTLTVATVDGTPITNEEIDAEFNQTLQYYDQMGPGAGVSLPMVEFVRANILDQVINRTILSNEAEKQGLRVGRGEVDNQIRRMVDAEVRQLRPSKSLEPTVRATLETKYKELESALRGQLLIQRLQQQVTKGVPRVTEQDLMNSFRSVKARHILVATQPSMPGQRKRSNKEAQARAQKLLEQIQGGGDFAQIAKTSSDDPGSAMAGGELGWSPVTNYDPAFAQAALKLKPGEMTAHPVKSAFGYHIIQVEAFKDDVPKDLAKTKKDRMKSLQDQRFQQVWSKFQQDLIAKAKVVVKDNELAGARLLMRGDSTAAMKRFEKAVQDKQAVYPRLVTGALYYNLGTWYGTQGNWKKAAASLEEAVDYASAGREQLYLELGKAYEKLGQPAKALEYYNLAREEVADREGTMYTHQRLAEAYKRLGKPDLAAAENRIFAAEQAKQAARMKAAQSPSVKVNPTPAGGSPSLCPPIAGSQSGRRIGGRPR